MHEGLGLVFILLATSAIGAERKCPEVFLHFTAREQVNENDTVASLDEQYLLGQSFAFQYSKSLQVIGTIADSAIDSDLYYNRFAPGQPGPSTEEVLTLARRLKTLGVFDLQSDKPNAQTPAYTAEIHFSADCQETHLAFSNTTAPEKRGQVIAEIRTFFNEQVLNYPLKKEERTSQGDKSTPISASIEELLATPERYEGKRIRTRGVYNLGYESSELSENGQSLWLGGWSSTAHDAAPLGLLNGRELTVEGIFFAGSSGHLGGYSGRIDRLTRATTK